MNEQTKLRQVLNLLWSELYGYPFDDWVADLRDDGTPWRRIERDVYDRIGLDVSYATLSTWYPQLRDEAAA